ncbi:B117 [miniopterid betaherpesvirus 1]|uniref:B117 n=1 Tax=miniopterid betaherpesvirus 1 TaxID=3070189 RepID=I3VQA7_9BETA|nr:B117 [miniopterid betaherpesvirus 1]AFK83951.1 B117 [miniopterid betaherpesvirus 1]
MANGSDNSVVSSLIVSNTSFLSNVDIVRGVYTIPLDSILSANSNNVSLTVTPNADSFVRIPPETHNTANVVRITSNDGRRRSRKQDMSIILKDLDECDQLGVDIPPNKNQIGEQPDSTVNDLPAVIEIQTIGDTNSDLCNNLDVINLMVNPVPEFQTDFGRNGTESLNGKQDNQFESFLSLLLDDGPDPRGCVNVRPTNACIDPHIRDASSFDINNQAMQMGYPGDTSVVTSGDPRHTQLSLRNASNGTSTQTTDRFIATANTSTGTACSGTWYPKSHIPRHGYKPDYANSRQVIYTRRAERDVDMACHETGLAKIGHDLKKSTTVAGFMSEITRLLLSHESFELQIHICCRNVALFNMVKAAMLKLVNISVVWGVQVMSQCAMPDEEDTVKFIRRLGRVPAENVTTGLLNRPVISNESRESGLYQMYISAATAKELMDVAYLCVEASDRYPEMFNINIITLSYPFIAREHLTIHAAYSRYVRKERSDGVLFPTLFN